MKPLSIEEIKQLEENDYIYYVSLETDYEDYYQIRYSNDKYLALNDLGSDMIISFYKYGKTWVAYKNKEQAECKGELVELPCKVGDTVYRWLDESYDEFIVTNINLNITKNKTDYCLCAKSKYCGEEYFNKNDEGYEWVLTKEQAEQKLKELRGEV